MIDMPPVAILCGGKGTRLGELTKNTPKSLVKVLNRPFIEWQLDWLAKQGVTKVLLCIGHLGGQIAHAVGETYAGMRIGYVGDGMPGQGTMRSIRYAATTIAGDFLSLYGDSWLPEANLAEIARLGSLCRTPTAQTVWKGADYGITYFRGKRIDEIPESYDKKNKEIGYLHLYGQLCTPIVMSSRWYQVGDPGGLSEVEGLLRRAVSL